MKKKVLWIIGVCIILISIWGIREIYLYNNPEVIITYSNENTEESHRSLPVYAINPKSRLAVLGEYVQFIVTISSASKEYAVSAFITVSGEMFHSIRLVARVMLGMDIESTTSTESSSKDITFVPISVVNSSFQK